jgi:hypothetical protein
MDLLNVLDVDLDLSGRHRKERDRLILIRNFVVLCEVNGFDVFGGAKLNGFGKFEVLDVGVIEGDAGGDGGCVVVVVAHVREHDSVGIGMEGMVKELIELL